MILGRICERLNHRYMDKSKLSNTLIKALTVTAMSVTGCTYISDVSSSCQKARLANGKPLKSTAGRLEKGNHQQIYNANSFEPILPLAYTAFSLSAESL